MGGGAECSAAVLVVAPACTDYHLCFFKIKKDAGKADLSGKCTFACNYGRIHCILHEKVSDQFS